MSPRPTRAAAGVSSPPDAHATVMNILFALSLAHLLNDTFQAMLPAIYPLLKSSYHLTFTQIGLITLTYQLTGSLLQPVVGYYTDRRPQPYSLPVGKKDPIGENNLAATFRFADGSIGTLNYSTVGSKTSAGERVEIFAPGLGGVAENFKSRELLGAIRTRRRRFWPQKGYAAQMQEFVDALRAGRAPAVTVKDGVRASMGCLAMLASAREGKPIPLSFT